MNHVDLSLNFTPEMQEKSPFVTQNVHSVPLWRDATTWIKSNVYSSTANKCRCVTGKDEFGPPWSNTPRRLSLILYAKKLPGQQIFICIIFNNTS